MQSTTNWEEIEDEISSPLPQSQPLNGKKENLCLPSINEVIVFSPSHFFLFPHLSILSFFTGCATQPFGDPNRGS